MRGRGPRHAAEEIGCPVVLKSQVLSGGRMKAGAVKFADTPDEAAAHFDADPPAHRGQRPEGPLGAGRGEEPDRPGVLRLGHLGRARKKPVLLFSDMGGIDIEEVAEKHPEHVSKTHFSTILPLTPRIAKEAIGAVGVTGSDSTASRRSSSS